MNNHLSESKEQEQQAEQNKKISQRVSDAAGTDKKLRGPNRPSV
ncbi:hypothetical protein [Paenibacillus rigui]|nr:hypothetical protein [Paenibacillus rigui]